MRNRVQVGLRGLGVAVVVACASLPATQALALWDDRVTPFVEEKLARDDNVFRISSDVDPAAIGSPTRGDNYRTTSLGLNADIPVSRQRFQVSYARNYVRYDQLTFLDLDGYDGRALWLWQLGNDANGQLSYAQNLALASFANIGGVFPDPVRNRQALFNAGYKVTPRWRLQAGAAGFEQRNGNPAFQSSDIDIASGDLNLSYTTPANTSIGLGARAEEGRYPNRGFAPGDALDNAYRQYGVDIVADWTLSGVSHLSGRVGRVSRRNEHLPERDFYGTALRAQYDWKPTGKFSLTATALQDISPYDDIRSSYVFVKAVSLRPAIQVSEKVDVSAALDYSIRDYLGDPGLVSGGVRGRTDRVLAAAATIRYKPVRIIALLVSAQHESRSSNIPFNDYSDNVVSAAIRIAF